MGPTWAGKAAWRGWGWRWVCSGVKKRCWQRWGLSAAPLNPALADSGMPAFLLSPCCWHVCPWVPSLWSPPKPRAERWGETIAVRNQNSGGTHSPGKSRGLGLLKPPPKPSEKVEEACLSSFLLLSTQNLQQNGLGRLRETGHG